MGFKDVLLRVPLYKDVEDVLEDSKFLEVCSTIVSIMFHNPQLMFDA